MEPLKPDERAHLLKVYPEAAPEIEEFQALLAGRFFSDPDFPPAPAAEPPRERGLMAPIDREEERQRRLGELWEKFGPVIGRR